MFQTIDKRGLPDAVETERVVLGGVMVDPDAYPVVAAILTAEDFTLRKHQVIFEAMSALHGRGEATDRMAVFHEIGDDARSVDGLSYLISLDNALPQIFGLDTYCRQVADTARRRRAILRLSALAEQIRTGDTSEAIVEAERIAESLRAPVASPLRSVGEIIEAAGGLDAILRPTRSRIGAVVPPWPMLAEIVPAFERGHLVLLAARPAVGKTIAASQIAVAAAQQGVGTIFLSLEMRGEALLRRQMCSLAEVGLGTVLGGWCRDGEFRSLHRAASELSELPIRYIDAGRQTPAALHGMITRERVQRPVGLVIVDYLGLMEGSGKTIYERVSSVSTGLKRLAMEQDVVVIAAVQLSRSNQAESRPPDLHDMRDSGQLEQDADTVIMLHQTKEKDMVDMFVRKQRYGKLGCVPMRRDGAFARLIELPQAVSEVAA